MVIISEVVHAGDAHIQFNSCFVEIVSLMHNTDRCMVVAEAEHAKQLEKYMLPNAQILPFPAYYQPDRVRWKRRILGEMSHILRILRYGRENDVEVYYWMCLFPTGHAFLNLLRKLPSFSKGKDVIVLHGELEMLKPNKRFTERMLGQILKFALRFSKTSTTYVVLGKSIRGRLSKYLHSPKLLARIRSIVHPYRYNDTTKNTSLNCASRPLHFGSIGRHTLQKNSQLIFSLAENLRTLIQDERLSLNIVGGCDHAVESEANSLVIRKFASGHFIPQAAYEIEVDKLDFVLFFYDNDSYELCASGALFETIRSGKIFISTKNSFFEGLFEEFGELGILCDDISEMSKVIEAIIARKCDGHLQRIFDNIKCFKEKSTLPKLALKLAKALKNEN